MEGKQQTSRGDTSDNSNQVMPRLTGHWLKEISVERVSSISPCNPTGEGDCSSEDETRLVTPCKAESSEESVTFSSEFTITQSTHSPTDPPASHHTIPSRACEQPDVKASACPDGTVQSVNLSTEADTNITPTNTSDFPPDTTPKPHLSSYERGGLLLLVHKMKNALFREDTPASILSPMELIAELELLLQSAIPQEACSYQPSGVGVVDCSKRNSHQTVSPHAKGRKRTSLATSPASRRLAKIETEESEDCPIFTEEVSMHDKLAHRLELDEVPSNSGSDSATMRTPLAPLPSLPPHDPRTPPHDTMQLRLNDDASPQSPSLNSTVTPTSVLTTTPILATTPTNTQSPLLLIITPTSLAASQSSSKHLASGHGELSPQQRAASEQTWPAIASHCGGGILSASSPAVLGQAFEEFTVTQIPNPTFIM